MIDHIKERLYACLNEIDNAVAYLKHEASVLGTLTGKQARAWMVFDDLKAVQTEIDKNRNSLLSGLTDVKPAVIPKQHKTGRKPKRTGGRNENKRKTKSRGNV